MKRAGATSQRQPRPLIPPMSLLPNRKVTSTRQPPCRTIGGWRKPAVLAIVFAAMATVLTMETTLASAAASAPASASEPWTWQLNESESEQARSFMTKYGVDDATQDNLLAKLKRGQAWDALNGESSPVSEETTTVDQEQVTIKTYADGSIEVSSGLNISELKSAAAGDISTFSIGSCDQILGSGPVTYYYGCHAWDGVTLIKLGFYLDFYIGSSAKITQIWGPDSQCIGCNLSDHRLEYWNSAHTKARHTAKITVGPTHGTVWVEGHVTTSGYGTTHS